MDHPWDEHYQPAISSCFKGGGYHNPTPAASTHGANDGVSPVARDRQILLGSLSAYPQMTCKKTQKNSQMKSTMSQWVCSSFPVTISDYGNSTSQWHYLALGCCWIATWPGSEPHWNRIPTICSQNDQPRPPKELPKNGVRSPQLEVITLMIFMIFMLVDEADYKLLRMEHGEDRWYCVFFFHIGLCLASRSHESLLAGGETTIARQKDQSCRSHGVSCPENCQKWSGWEGNHW